MEMPTIQVGKKGVNTSTIDEIKKQIKKKKIVKVKMLKSFIEGKDKKDLAKEIAEKTGADILRTVGFVVVLKEK